MKSEMTSQNFVDEALKLFNKCSYPIPPMEMYRAFIEYYSEKCCKLIQGKCNLSVLNHTRGIIGSMFDDFERLISQLAVVMGERPYDYLGEIYFRLNMNNKHNGQFFTPFHISELLVKVNNSVEEAKNASLECPFTVNDPACGSGSLLIAQAKVFNESKINPMNVTLIGQDIDDFVARMCYLQLIAIGACGIVKVGNSLIAEENRIFYTPLASQQKIMTAPLRVESGVADKDDLMICEVAKYVNIFSKIFKK